MIGLLVAYGYDRQLAARWNAFADAAELPKEGRFVVDNAQGELADLAGSNDQLEFSGYLEGLQWISARHGDLDRVVIFNDTLFGHHWSTGWAGIVRDGPRDAGIWGDGRLDRVDRSDRSLRFIASWHFDLVGAAAIETFTSTLAEAVDSFDRIGEDPAYEAHLGRYLRSSIRRGYSNPASIREPATRARKLACIRTEHRLSAEPKFAAVMRFYTGPRYRAVHAADRLLSARRRLRSLRSS